MKGLDLHRDELVALLTRQISDLTVLGVSHERALAEVARRRGVHVDKLRRLCGTEASTASAPAREAAQ